MRTLVEVLAAATREMPATWRLWPIGPIGVVFIARVAIEVTRRRERGYVHVSEDTITRLRQLEGQ